MDYEKTEHMSPWLKSGLDASITEITIDTEIKPLTTAYWFQGLRRLYEIDNIDKLDLSFYSNGFNAPAKVKGGKLFICIYGFFCEQYDDVNARIND